MRFAKKLAVTVLALILTAAMLAGCGNGINGNKTVTTVNGEKLSLGSLAYYVKYEQAYMSVMYSSLMSQLGGQLFDTVTDEENGTTVGSGMITDCLTTLEKYMVASQHAADYGVELTDEEKAKIDEIAEAYIKENDPSNTDNASRELKLLNECLITKIKEAKGTDDAWLYKFAPEKTINSIRQRTTSEETKRKISGDSTPVDFWSFISYEEIAQIAGYTSNWTDWLQVILTANGQLKKTKVQTINWLKALDVYEKRITDSKAVLGSQYSEIHELFLAFGLE